MDMFVELFKYYNAGDLKNLLSMMDDDAVIEWPSPVVAPFSGKWQGTAELAQWFGIVASVFESFTPLVPKWILQAEKEGHFIAEVSTTNVKFRASNTTLPTLALLNSFEINHVTGKVKRLVGHYENPKQVLDAMLTVEQSVVVAAFDHIRAGRVDAFFDLLADDIVINILNNEYLNIGFKLEYRGKKEVEEWIKHCAMAFHVGHLSWRLDVHAAGPDPSVVVVHAVESTTPKKGSGIRAELLENIETMRIFNVMNGKISRVRHMVVDSATMEKFC